MDVELLWGVFASSIAGLSTIIGAIPILFVKEFTPRLYATGLGISSGILIYISFIEIFQEGLTQIIDSYLYKVDLTSKEKEYEEMSLTVPLMISQNQSERKRSCLHLSHSLLDISFHI